MSDEFTRRRENQMIADRIRGERAQESPMRVQIAVLIATHDHDNIPEGYSNDITHPSVSDWALYLADKIIEGVKAKP